VESSPYEPAYGASFAFVRMSHGYSRLALGTLFVVALLAIPVAAHAGSTPAVATTVNYAQSSPGYSLYENNNLDDCAVVAAANLAQTWNAELNLPAGNISTSAVLSLFGRLGGGAANGVPLRSVVNAWGLSPLGGQAITSSGLINPDNIRLVKKSIYLLGGLYVEAELSPSAQWQMSEGLTVTGGPAGQPSLAHAFVLIGYDANYVDAVTFGRVVKISWSWWTSHAVQAWGLIPSTFIAAGHGPVAGIDIPALTNFLARASR
jgi:hypothetical protein